MTTSSRSKRIAVGIDGSPNSHRAATWAIENAHAGDTVLLVHAWQQVVVGSELGMAYAIDDTGDKELLQQEFNLFVTAAKEHNVVLEQELLHGDARECLELPNIDLLVVGARGHGGIVGVLLGSVADYLARHSRVPVVIIPAESHQ